MGQTFSSISDDKLRIETKKAYDASLAMMIINLLVISLPTISFYWIPYAGPWTILTLSFIQIIFSVLIFKLSARAIPNYGPSLSKAHVMISLLMWVLIVISCIMQTVHWNDRQQYCNDYSYNYGGEPYSYSYCYSYSGYNYYLPSLILMGVITPILSLAHMIIFSINCSYIWNEMTSVAVKCMQQGLPLRTVNLGGNGGPGFHGIPSYYPDGLPVYGTFPGASSNGEQAVNLSLTQGQYNTVQKALEAQRI